MTGRELIAAQREMKGKNRAAKKSNPTKWEREELINRDQLDTLFPRDAGGHRRSAERKNG